MAQKKGVIIGLDGVPYSLLNDLSNQGVMPFFHQLTKDSHFTEMSSSLPPNSAVSWSSMITGCNPGEHGVYGFMELMKKSYVNSFHSSKKLKASPFWHKNPKRKHLIINLPASYPATQLSDVLVTGFVSPNMERAVYPPDLAGSLNEIDYRIDVDVSRAEESVPLFLKELNGALWGRLNALDLLLEQYKWDTLMLVITGTDRIEHYLWNAYRDHSHPYHQEFLDFFRQVDEILEAIIERVGLETPLMMLSDHGMDRIEKSLNINTLLVENGYLKLGDNPRKSYNNIMKETKAFAVETHKIHINKAHHYPRGMVQPTDEDALLDELNELFLSLKHKKRNVVKSVHRRDDVFKGAHMDNAPDLVVLPERGVSLKTGLFKESLFEADRLQGTHTEDDAFLLIKGMDAPDQLPESLSIEDTLGIFNKMIGVN